MESKAMSSQSVSVRTAGRLLLSLGLFVLLPEAVHSDLNEYRLLRHLMENYDSNARPVANSTKALQVVFGMSLHLLIDVDERNQILTTNCWLTQKWNDSHLTWNASDYGGIHVVRIPYHRVWRPDIILYNNADAQYTSSVINTNVIVSDNGEVVWLSHGIFRSSCDINVEYFPFDLQSCKMKWASWTYDGFQIDLKKQTDEGDVSNYQTNGEFDLVDFEAIHHEEYYSCCPEPYPDITYVIKMKRRPLFYVFNLILPCLLINGIALLVFYVPSESGEKVTLGISSLLSMTVFLMTIRESLPPTEKTPLISLYYGVSICLVSFASGLSVVTLNLHHRGLRGTEVPYILRRIILGGLARLVFLRFDVDKRHSPASTPTSAPAGDPSSSHSGDPIPASRLASRFEESPTKTCASGDPRCTCGKSRNINQRGRHQPVGVSATRSSGWYSTPVNGGPSCSRNSQERLRLRLQELEPRATDVYLDPEFSDKFQSAELDFLGIGPPSPKFYSRRVPSTSKAPHFQQQQQQPLINPESASGSSAEIGGGFSILSQGSIYEQRLTQLMARVSTAVERNENRLEEQDRREAIALEWKQLALVCDRILLLTFVIITTVATCVVLTSSPYGP
ncbi:neuronal acetylcholine receptor subunit alpha-10-like [Daphnia carinata]|uniref:neuronal acetylcholine receptor subunit alpha-10-like n=1 Tax=Daphnia carinata TaxID=120202 RepID=UPI00257BAE32|nr:neuronal acetylcholine receptor subunit alpha-10-like [Daphnia carinata]